MRPQDRYAFRMRMVTRLAALIQLAQSGQQMPSLGSLALEHGCSERTIRRDLEAIELLMPVAWRQAEAA